MTDLLIVIITILNGIFLIVW